MESENSVSWRSAAGTQAPGRGRGSGRCPAPQDHQWHPGARGDARDAAAGWEVGAENGGGGQRFIFLRSRAGGVADPRRDIVPQRPSRGCPAYRPDRRRCPRAAGNPKLPLPSSSFPVQVHPAPERKGDCDGGAAPALRAWLGPDCPAETLPAAAGGRAGKLPIAIRMTGSLFSISDGFDVPRIMCLLSSQSVVKKVED